MTDTSASTSGVIADRLSGLHHVSINVDDLAATERFYVDMFGFAVLLRPDFEMDGRWLDMGRGLQLHLIDADVPSQCGQHFALNVDDVDACRAELIAVGVEASDVFPAGDLRQFFVEDPSGNRVEINGPA